MLNPYAARFVTASGEPVSEFKYKGSKVIDEKTGEINAHDKKEAIQQIGRLISAAASGEIRRDRGADEASVRELVIAALNDPTGQAMKVVGEVMAEEISIAMDREGFARRILAIKDLEQGEVPRIPVRRKDVMGWMMTQDARTPVSIVRQAYVTLEEFYLTANIQIEARELASSPVDLLDEKYAEGLEQIMVAEDRAFKVLSDKAASTSNEIVYFNTFTPAVFADLRQQIANWNLPVVAAVIASDIWNDIIASPDFSNWFDPVTKYNLILEGKLGSILGIELITDAFREERLRVLNPGEVYFFTAPKHLGVIARRQDVTSKPTDGAQEGRPYQGWYLYAIEGMAVVNSRGVTKGQRIA